MLPWCFFSLFHCVMYFSLLLAQTQTFSYTFLLTRMSQQSGWWKRGMRDFFSSFSSMCLLENVCDGCLVRATWIFFCKISNPSWVSLSLLHFTTHFLLYRFYAVLVSLAFFLYKSFYILNIPLLSLTHTHIKSHRHKLGLVEKLKLHANECWQQNFCRKAQKFMLLISLLE